MDTSAIIAIAALGPDGMLIDNVSCKRCGYNLRGLSATGRCPECATLVGKSLTGDLLRFADPRWLGMLVRGLNILLWSVLAVICGAMLGGALSVLLPGAPWAGVFQLLAGGLSFHGTWLLTSPDPSGVGEDAHVNARRLTRQWTGAALALSAVWLLLAFLPFVTSVGWFPLLEAAISGIVAAVATYFQFRVCEHLADRVPDKPATRRARVLRRVMPIVFLLQVTCLFAALVGPATPPGGAGAALSFFMVISLVQLVISVVLLVCGISAIVLYFRLRRLFREQRQLAEAAWGAAPGEAGTAPAA